jgi:hypothetical protein
MSFEISDAGDCPGPSGMSVYYNSDCSAQISWSPPAKMSNGEQPREEENSLIKSFISTQTTQITQISADNIIKSSASTHKEQPDFLGDEPLNASPPDIWIKWCGANYDAIGTGGAAEFIVAARFLPSDLMAAGIKTGDKMTKIRFVPQHSAYATFVVGVWSGGTSPTNPGNLVHEQQVTGALVDGQYNEIPLSTPVVIDASKEVWICYLVRTTYGFPAGCDAGPSVYGKGDLMFYQGVWSNLMSIAGISANWNIDALVSTGGSSQTTYKIYRNGALIASNIKETFYTDKGFSPYEKQTWTVKKEVCDSGGESAPATVTKESCIVGIDNIAVGAMDVLVYPNPTTGELRIENEELRIENVEIFDVFGKKIFHSPFSILNSFDLTVFPPGIYFIRIQTENSVVTKKIIKK